MSGRIKPNWSQKRVQRECRRAWCSPTTNQDYWKHKAYKQYLKYKEYERTQRQDCDEEPAFFPVKPKKEEPTSPVVTKRPRGRPRKVQMTEEQKEAILSSLLGKR